MPRGARLDIEGALHHVMVRGLERRKVFLTRVDREDLVERLAAVVPWSGAGVYAWSLLPNHFHLLIRTGPVPLAKIMRKVLTGYAISFNHRHHRAGHLFQNRYKSILVEEEPYLLELVRYIHLNPLRAKVVGSVEELAAYPWSGHGALLGKVSHPWQDCRYILGQFGRKGKRGRGIYEKFVNEGVGQGRREDLAGGGLVRSLGGWEKVKSLGRGREKWSSDERVLGSSEFVEEVLKDIEGGKGKRRFVHTSPPGAFDHMVEKVGKKLGLSRGEVVGGSRRRKVVRARNIISYVAVHEYGFSLKEVSEALRVSKQSVLRGLEAGEVSLKKQIEKIGEFNS